MTTKNITPEAFGKRAAPLLAIINAKSTDNRKAAEQLRAYHEVGRLVLELVPEKPEYNSKRFSTFAAAIGRQQSWLYKVRQFAQKYDRRQLGELCRHAQLIHWKHIIRLLALPVKKRTELQSKIAAEKWSAEKLARHLRASRGPGHAGGRELIGVADPLVGLHRLADLGRQWVKFSKVFAEKGNLQQRLAAPTEKLAQAIQDAREATVELGAELRKVRKRLTAAAAALSRKQRQKKRSAKR